MTVVVAKNAGFCFGVRKAYNLALSVAGQDVCVLGELIHNQLANANLEAAGVKIVNTPSEADSEKVIIRTHGEPPSTYEYLYSKGKEIIDATCPFVKNIHRIVAENYSTDYRFSRGRKRYNSRCSVLSGGSNYPQRRKI